MLDERTALLRVSNRLLMLLGECSVLAQISNCSVVFYAFIQSEGALDKTPPPPLSYQASVSLD